MMSAEFVSRRVNPIGVEGRDAPLRTSDVDAVLCYVRGREQKGLGGVYFLVGPEWQGSARVLDGIADGLATSSPRSNVLRGSLTSGAFSSVSVNTARSSIDRAEDVAKVVQFFLLRFMIPAPVQELVARLVEVSAAALRLAQADGSSTSPRTRPDPVTRLLAQATDDRPLVLLVDGVDSDGAAWFSDLLEDEWAVDVATDRRVFFVVSLDGPPVCPETERDLPPALRAATRLTRQGLAEWGPLGSLERADVQAWLGPARDSLITHLWTVSGGIPALVESTWADWMASRSVELDGERLLAFTNNADTRSAHDLNSVATKRIRALLPATEDFAFDPLLALKIGALQGESFTADAVSQVIDLDDHDSLIDLLSNRLGGDATAHPVLGESDHHSVIDLDGHVRHLRRFRFTSTGLWLGLRTRGLAPDQRRGYASQLALALEQLYGAFTPAVGRELSVLHALAGDSETAAHWQCIHEEGSNPDLLRWRGHLVLACDHENWTPSQRAHGVRLLFNAFEPVWRLPANEINEYSRIALLLAEGADSMVAHGEAFKMAAGASFRSGDIGSAVQHSRDAVAAWSAVPDLATAAACAVDLAALLHSQGQASGISDGQALKQEMSEALDLAQQQGTGDTAGRVLLLRSELTQDPNYKRKLLLQALTVLTINTIMGIEGRARTWRNLAVLEIPTGDLARAKQWLERAEQTLRTLESPRQLCYVLQRRGIAEVGAGEFDSAIGFFREAKQIAASQGLRQLTLDCELGTAFAAAFGGTPDRAMDALLDANELADTAEERAYVDLCGQQFDVISSWRAAGSVGPALARDPESLQRLFASRFLLLKR